MKKVLFIIVLGMLSVGMFSCSPTDLEEVIPVSETTSTDTVGEDGDIDGGEDEDEEGE